MQRRDFLALTAALASMPFGLSAASDGLPYSPGLVTSSFAAGKTVFFGFQGELVYDLPRARKVISALKSQNPDYEKHITFIDVDWDFLAVLIWCRS